MFNCPRKFLRFFASFATAIAVAIIPPSHGAISNSVLVAQAAEVADPDYQIKLRLDPKVVQSPGVLTEQAAILLNAGPLEESEQLAYFDSADGALSDLGWTVRLRHKTGSTEYDITYKRRAELADNSLSKKVVDAGLSAAKESNFDSSDTNYEAQVNASYFTTTLDFSNKKSVSCLISACIFPDEAEALDLVINKEPGKLTKDLGGSLAAIPLSMSPVVIQWAWPIEVDGISTTLEVTEMNGEYWVEVSEPDGSRKDAISKRARLVDSLSQMGLLIEEDAFKTVKVLEGSWS